MVRLDINKHDDAVAARMLARNFADHGPSTLRRMRIAAVVNELARQLLAENGGHMEIGWFGRGEKEGIRCVFVSRGGGAPKAGAAETGGNWDTETSEGLSGVKQLVDDFDLVATPDGERRIEIIAWI